HQVGRIGKFPCPQFVESCLESVNPSSLRRICMTSAEQLVNTNAMSFADHPKFAEPPGIEFVFQLFSHGLGNQDLGTEVFVQRLKTRSEVRRISNHRVIESKRLTKVAGEHFAAVDANSGPQLFSADFHLSESAEVACC